MDSKAIESKIDFIIKEHRRVAGLSFESKQRQNLMMISEVIAKALQKGKKLLLCGNGGSAADSQHIAAEFISKFKIKRSSLPAIALTTDTSILTAIANDDSFESVFKRQVEGLGEKGDVLIGISTSGRSKNVIAAVKTAKQKGLTTISFTGEANSELKSSTDFNFSALSDVTSLVQEMHITALHAISEVVEEILSK